MKIPFFTVFIFVVLNDQPFINRTQTVVQTDIVTLTLPDDVVPNTAKCEVSLVGKFDNLLAECDSKIN